MSLVPTHLHLSHHQIQKARRGHPIQLSAGALHKNTHMIHLHPENHKKVMRAKKAKKGVRIHLGEHELHASGFFDKLKDFGQKVKKGFQVVKEKVIDTPFYQQTIKPLARKAVDMAIDTYVPAPYKDVAHKAENFVGDKTGAFGLKKRRHRKGAHPQSSKTTNAQGKGAQSSYYPVEVDRDYSYPLHLAEYYAPVKDKYAPKFELEEGQQTFLNPAHPAMWPTMPYLPPIGGKIRKLHGRYGTPQSGGSFMAAGMKGKRGPKGGQYGNGGSFKPT